MSASAPNLSRAGGQPPLIIDLDRHQAIGPGDVLPVSTRVVETDAPVESVTLTWRVMFGEEQRVEMVQDGETWAAELPADIAAAGQLIRWYVVAQDAAGRTERFPPFLDPLDSERYYGTMVDPGPLQQISVVDSSGVLRAILTGPQVAFSGAALGTVLEERAGSLEIRWNPQAMPGLSVVHLGAQRTALGLELRDGAAVLSTVGLPPGGSFELQWSDGLNSWTEIRAR